MPQPLKPKVRPRCSSNGRLVGSHIRFGQRLGEEINLVFLRGIPPRLSLVQPLSLITTPTALLWLQT